MIDRTTKILLGLIAFGLFANAAVSLIRPAIADNFPWGSLISGNVNDVKNSVYGIKQQVEGIYSGRCSNNKIC